MTKLVSKLITGGGLLSSLVFTHDSYVRSKAFLEKENLLSMQEKAGNTITGKLGINPEYYRLKDEVIKLEKYSKEEMWMPEQLREPLFNLFNNFWSLWENTAGSIIEKMFLSFGIPLSGASKVLVFAFILLLDLIILRALIKFFRKNSTNSNNNSPAIHIHNYLSAPAKELKQDVLTFFAWGVLFLAVRGSYATVKEDGNWLYTEVIRFFYPAKPVPFLEQNVLVLEIKVWQALLIMFILLVIIAYIFDLLEKIKSLNQK